MDIRGVGREGGTACIRDDRYVGELEEVPSEQDGGGFTFGLSGGRRKVKSED